MSDDQESSIDQNKDNISLSSIDEDTSVIYEDIDEDISKDEEIQDNKTYDLTEAIPLEHYEENDSDANENDEYSSIHQSLDEDRDQQDESIEKDENEGAYHRSNLRPSRSNAGKGVEKLNMIFKGKHYPSVTKKQLLMLKNNNITENKDSYFDKAIGVMFTQMSAKEGIKQFGEKAIAAMVKELKQLNNGAMKGKPVVVPINPSKLTKFEKKMLYMQ